MNDNPQNVTISLAADLKRAVDSAAAQEYRSRASWIRRAIARQLEVQGRLPAERAQAPEHRP